MRYMPSVAISAGIVLMAGCGDSTGVSLEDLTGTWNTTHYMYINPADTTQAVDLISAQGASFILTVASDSSVSTVFDNGQGGSSSDSGTFDADGAVLMLAGNAFAAARLGDRLTLTDDTNAYDFDGNGSDELAQLRIEMRRQ